MKPVPVVVSTAVPPRPPGGSNVQAPRPPGRYITTRPIQIGYMPANSEFPWR